MYRYYVLDTPPRIERAFALLCSALLYIRLSGTYPSTTATAPTLPASAEPFSSEMTEMTSLGSSKCQLASVCLELAPTVTEKTWSIGSLD